ncbi:OsmC family protein [Pseudomonas putida S11]|nr:OsmC family protein [Pseudomonas putida S11]
MQKVTPLYIAEATSTGGRDGKSRSSDGKLVVSLSTPKELGGAGGDGTNPEQMFAAGYSACFIGALKFVAGQEKKSPAGGRLDHRESGHWPDSRWFRPGHRPAHQPAGPGPGRCRRAGGKGAQGVPVLQRHPRQRGCAPARYRVRLARSPCGSGLARGLQKRRH